MILHGYFRSSASWRVRIALNLKRMDTHHAYHHLRNNEQLSASYLALNPQGLVPALELDDGAVLTQSLAIIEWMEETIPDPPLLPKDPIARARIRAFALAIAADTHPLQNLRVLRALKDGGQTQDQIDAWAQRVITEGLAACEQLVANQPGPFCFGNTPSYADIFLVPQLGNARRFKVDLAPMPTLLAREAACIALPEFAAAAPERQADAE